MALIWDGTANDRASTSDINGLAVDTSCALSACGWCTGNTATRSPFGISNGSNLQFELLRRSATNDLNAFGYGAGPFFTNLALPSSSSEWWFWALSISGTASGNAHLYVWTSSGGWTSSASSAALQAVSSPSVITWGNGPVQVGSEMWVGKALGLKIWNAVLSESELQAERLLLLPKRQADLTHAVPGVGSDSSEALRDLVGNTWSLTGTITYDSDVPSGVSYGAMLSLPGVQDITSSGATPKVTLTF